MAQMLQEGEVYQYTTTGAITAGNVQRIGARLAGVALQSATGSGKIISVALEGVHSLTAVATGAKAYGALCYLRATGVPWSVAMTATGSTGATGATGSQTAYVLGTVWEAAATTATTLKVRLSGRPMRKL